MNEKNAKKQARRIRSNVVIKSDKLVSARYEYSTNALKLANILISLINKYTHKKELITEQEFNLKGYFVPFAVLMELYKINDLKYFKEIIVNAVNDLDRGKIWIDNETYLNLISAVKFGSDGIITFYFHSQVTEHLLNLSKKFVAYKTENILNLNNSYAIRLYEILKANQYRKNYIRFTVNELKSMLNATAKAFNRYNNFKRLCVETAKKLIEQNTDIIFNYREINKKGSKAIEFIEFYGIKYKDVKKQEIYSINEIDDIIERYKGEKLPGYEQIKVPDEDKNDKMYNHLYRNFYSNTVKNLPKNINFDDYIKMQGFRIAEYPTGGKYIEALQTELNL